MAVGLFAVGSTLAPGSLAAEAESVVPTFELPSGMREPYENQILIAHADANGSAYSVGMYRLTATSGDACNWQSDLYFGDSAMPVFGDELIVADFLEGQVCNDVTTSTPITITIVDSTVPTTTQADQGGGQNTTTTTTSTSTTTTTTTDVAGGGPTTTQAVGAGGSQSLPATGPTETLMISLLGGTLLGLGAFARRMARS